MSRLNTPFALTAIALVLGASLASAEDKASLAPLAADPLARPTEVMPLADSTLVLDIARAGNRIVAVGERGHILYSDDGQGWTQAADVPLRSTLTAVAAVDGNIWAVGHDGVILHSANSGESWEIQRRDPRGQPAEGVDPDDIRQGAPLLDVLFTDLNHGIAIGAYSLFLETSDGGKHWSGGRIRTSASDAAADAEAADKNEEEQAAHSSNDMQSSVFSADELKIGQESDPHLNAIARTGSGGYVIVGERGAIFRSDDGGKLWQRSQLPYDGSMFGIVGYEGQHVLAFGLRGHVFESTDLGVTWTEQATGSELSLMGGVPLDNGGAIIVGANGIVLRRARDSEALTTSTNSAAGVIAGVLPLDSDGTLLIASENGLSRFQPK
ncbi:MAG: hypothetical protein KDI80_04960 [Xanthomonadales bacterium]|nr:hypothetical protein [Xanthomonadales bacterium]